MKITTSFVAAALTAAVFVSPAAAQIDAYHDVDGAAHQQKFNTLPGLGYRMISLSIYGNVNDPRYAAVWVHRAGPDFVGFHGLNGTEYQDFVDTHWPAGYRPTILSATGSPGNPRFAGVMELTNTGGWASHGLTEQQFWDERGDAADLGFDVVAVDLYGSGADPRYIVSFGPTNYGQSEVVSSGVNGFQDHFDALSSGHARPSFIGTNEANRFVSLWRSDDVGDWVAHHDMTSTEYDNLANLYWPAKYPITVQASGAGNNARFAAVFADSDLPAAKVWTKTGPSWGPFQPFDTWVKDWMDNTDTRAASLAIVKDHKLVYARGYTLARAGYPITQPTSMFKTASTSKPITSIAMHQHFEDAAMNMDPTDAMLDYFPWINPAQQSMNQISLNSLLTHQGGWDRGVSPDPMIAFDTTVAGFYNANLPISKQLIRNYMLTTQQLDFTPNTDYAYSNFGFSLLGQVLEQKNPGKTYVDIVERDIFQPLGLTRPKLARSNKADLHPGEVVYHPYTPLLMRSVVDNNQPWVAGQYGGLNKENMDSHGGWVMAAPDFAKILAAFDLGASNPLMTPNTADEMFTVEPGFSTVMRGWYKVDVDDGFGGTEEMYHHGGYLYGARCFIARRADGLSFVFMTNGDRRNLAGNAQGVELNDIANMITAWPQTDLFPNFSIPPFRPRPGSISHYGHACYGSHGFPGFQVSGTPEVGEELTFDLSFVAPNHFTFLMLGVNANNLNLTPFGAYNCFLLTDMIATFGDVSSAAGTSTFKWTAPANAAAIGVSIFSQGAIIDPVMNPLGLVTTHGIEIELGGWQ